LRRSREKQLGGKSLMEKFYPFPTEILMENEEKLMDIFHRIFSRRVVFPSRKIQAFIEEFFKFFRNGNFAKLTFF
jgi:hypothetical protein